MRYEVFDTNITILNHEGTNLTESIVDIFYRNDFCVAQSNEYYITYSGDRQVFIDRWLHTSEVVKPDQVFSTMPFLKPKEKLCISDEKKAEIGAIPNDSWFFVNTARKGPSNKNRIELEYPYDTGRYIYCLAYVFCSKEQDLFVNINNSHNPLPMRMWINGVLVFCSPKDCVSRRSESLFRFNSGGNIVIVERRIDPQNKIKDRYMDTHFTLELIPVRQLLKDHSDDKYFDIDYVTRTRHCTRIVVDKAVYADDEDIHFFVMPGFYNKGFKKKRFEVSLYDSENKNIFKKYIGFFEIVTIKPKALQRGVIKIEAGYSANPRRKSQEYILIGDYHGYCEELCKRVKNRTDCDEKILSCLMRLIEIPDFRKNSVRYSIYPLDTCVFSSLFKALWDIQMFLLKPEAADYAIYSDVFVDGGMFFSKNRYSGGAAKAYSIFLPEGYDRQKKYPLVVQYVAAYGIYPIPGLNGQYVREYLYHQDYGEAIIAIVPCFYDRYSVYEIIGFIDAIRDMTENFSINVYGISILGFCGSASICTQVARYIPHMLSNMVLLAPYIEDRFITDALEKNTANIKVIQIGNVEKGLFMAGFRYMKYFRDIEFAYSDGFEHEEFFNCYCSKKLVERLIRHETDRFPQIVEFDSDVSAFGRSYWLKCTKVENVEEHMNFRGQIYSGDEICIITENVKKLVIYCDREKMGFNHNIRLTVNDLSKVIDIGDYGLMEILISKDEWEYEYHVKCGEDFESEHNKIDYQEYELGIRQIYINDYLILSDGLQYSADSDLADNLLILLDRAVKNAGDRNNRKRIVDNLSINEDMLKTHNLIYILTPLVHDVCIGGKISDPGITVTQEGICYRGQTFRGKCFALVKDENPYDARFSILYVIYNSKEGLEGLNELLKRFDNEQVLYNDAVIFHDDGCTIL